MKPAIFAIPENVKSIAIINRDVVKNYATTLSYSYAGQEMKDTTINYKLLSSDCIEALRNYLNDEGNFNAVVNLSDSLAFILKDPYKNNRNQLFKYAKTDALIFLDKFSFDNAVVHDYKFPFNIRTELLWVIDFKSNPTPLAYTQIETLAYNQSEYRNFRLLNDESKLQYINASIYIGQSFGAKMISGWVPVERKFYTSRNPEMKRAESYANNGEWELAAEIWSAFAINKNLKLAAKANFNMALACEMNGKPEDSIEWLYKSYWSNLKRNETHENNCVEYISILRDRIAELEQLEKQIQNKKFK